MPRPDAGSKPVAVRQGDRGSKATSYTKNLRRDAARRHSSYLISFIFSLDHEAQSLQEAVIKHGLETAFQVFASSEPASTPSSAGVPRATISVSLSGSGRCTLIHGVQIQAKSSSGRSRARSRSVNAQCLFDDDEPGLDDCVRSECRCERA